MAYNSLEEYLKHQRELDASGERAINYYPLDAKASKPYVFRTWGEFFGVICRGFFVTCGLLTACFIVYCVGRVLWMLLRAPQ